MATSGCAQPAHAVSQPGRRQPHLGIAQPFSRRSEDVAGRHSQALETHNAVAAGEAGVQRTHRTLNTDAGGVHVCQKHRGVTVFQARHDDGKASPFSTGDEPLNPIDQVVIAVLSRSCLQHSRVGASTRRRLGHTEAGANLTRCQRAQPPFALLVRSHFVEQMHVALVRSGNVQRYRAERRIARFLEEDRLAHMIQAQATQLGGHVTGQQPLGAPERYQLAAQVLVRAMGGATRVVLERNDFLGYESARAILEIALLGRKIEDRHRRIP
ncbi:hypothetical protein D3C80_1388260 [compost metagenome]